MGRIVVRASFVRAAALVALLLLLLASNPQSVLGGPEDAPDKPTGLTGDVYHDRVELRWDEPADDDIVTGYRILRLDRAVHGLGNFQVHVDDTGSPQNSYTDTNVEPDTRYVYRIHARNGDDLSPRSKWFDADTPEAPADPEPTDPPAMPTGLTGTASHDRVALRWDDPADDDRVTGYQVLRGHPVDGEETRFGVLVDDTGSADSSYTDGDVDDDTAYAYRIRARNAAGLGPESDAFDARTPVLLPPAAPQVFAAHVFSAANVVVEWTSDAGDHSITGYRILRGLSEDSLVEIEDDTGLDNTGPGWGHYTDTTAPAGRTVYYAVQARNDAGLSPTSNAFEATIPGPAVPGAPWLMASGSGPDGVFLLWAQDPPDDSITGYRILRGESEDSLAEIVPDTGSTDTTYTDTTAPAGRTVYYAVQARNANGLSEQSNTRSADIPAAQEPLISQRQDGDQVLLSTIDRTSAGLAGLVLNSPSAQAFTTGPSGHAYVITRVQIRMDGTNNPVVTASIMSGDDSPETVVHDLTLDGTIPSSTGIVTFVADVGAILDPATKYWVVLTRTSGGSTNARVAYTTASGLDDGAPGWDTVGDRLSCSSTLTCLPVLTGARQLLRIYGEVTPLAVLMDYIGDIDHIGTVGRTFLFKPPQDPVYDGDTRFVSQAFRTAGGQRNHLLDSLDLHTFVFNTPLPDSVLSKVEAWLHRGTDSNPYIANQVYVLTPSEIVDERTIRFTAPDGATLLPNTIYWVNVRAKENFERAVAFHSGGPGFSELAGGRWHAVQTVPARHRTSDSADWVDARTSDTAMDPLFLRLRVHGFDGVGALVDPALMDYVTTDTPFTDGVLAFFGVTTGADAEETQYLQAIATDFDTGGGLFPHALDSIELYIDPTTAVTDAFLSQVEATIHWGSGHMGEESLFPREDEVVYTLTPSAVSGSATTGYVVKFDAPEGAYLLPGTNYWFQVRATQDTGILIGRHVGEEFTDQAGRGWMIDGLGAQLEPGKTLWEGISGFRLRLRVNGVGGGGVRHQEELCPPVRFKSLALPDCEVTFRDPTLRGIIEAALGKSSGETIKRADMASITTLRAGWRGITSTDGLQYATGLQILQLGHNRIGGTVDLSELTNLRTIDLENNRITSLLLPSSLHTLYTLDASENRIASIDLPWARDIFRLDLTGNRLTSINLSRLGGTGRATNIDTLYVGLGDNLLTSVTLGGSAGRITSLNLDRNRFTSLSLPNMGNVTRLNAGNNHDLASFTIGNGSDKLKTLLLHACDLSSLNVTGLNALRYINVLWNGTVTVTGAHADATVEKD